MGCENNLNVPLKSARERFKIISRDQFFRKVAKISSCIFKFDQNLHLFCFSPPQIKQKYTKQLTISFQVLNPTLFLCRIVIAKYPNEIKKPNNSTLVTYLHNKHSEKF